MWSCLEEDIGAHHLLYTLLSWGTLWSFLSIVFLAALSANIFFFWSTFEMRVKFLILPFVDISSQKSAHIDNFLYRISGLCWTLLSSELMPCPCTHTVTSALKTGVFYFFLSHLKAGVGKLNPRFSAVLSPLLSVTSWLGSSSTLQRLARGCSDVGCRAKKNGRWA